MGMGSCTGRIFKRQKSLTILLSGLSRSGKTVLFYKLRDGSAHQDTVTSMEPIEGSFVLHSEKITVIYPGKVKHVRLIDIPGHSLLKAKLDEFLPLAAGLILVVDALNFIPNLRAASDDKLRASISVLSAVDILNDFTLGVLGELFSFIQCQNKVTVAEFAGITVAEATGIIGEKA